MPWANPPYKNRLLSIKTTGGEKDVHDAIWDLWGLALSGSGSVPSVGRPLSVVMVAPASPIEKCFSELMASEPGLLDGPPGTSPGPIYLLERKIFRTGLRIALLLYVETPSPPPHLLSPPGLLWWGVVRLTPRKSHVWDYT
jgi:hypothetical protein